MKIKCFAIDEEPYALQQIIDNILKTPFLEFMGICNNTNEAKEFVAQNSVDLIFMDIKMQKNGNLNFIKALSPQTKIIFTSPKNNYAFENNKSNAIDYLLKPIAYDDFLYAATKAQKLLENYQMVG